MPKRPSLPSMCTKDITVDDEQYRYHISSDYIVIKQRTFGKDNDSYGGWSFYAKFGFDEQEQALNEWRKLYNLRDNGGLHAKDVVVSETDLKKMDSQKDNALSFSTTEVVHWHNAATQFGKIAVLCAAKAGAELNAIKAECRQGEWKKVLETLPFSTATARNYRELADKMQQRLMEQGCAFDLEGLPEPQYLADPENAEIIEEIREVTNEQSLRQLYFDWGIMSKPKALGGKREPEKDLNISIEKQRQFAREAATEFILDVNLACVDPTTSKLHLLEIPMLRALEEMLQSAINETKVLIKAG